MRGANFIALGLLLALPAWASHLSLADDSMEAQPKPEAEATVGETELADGGGDRVVDEAASIERMPTASVSRATFTTGVSEYEPTDSVTELTSDHVIVYFFSELNDLAGQTVVHRWEYNGELMSEVPLAVAGPRWRTYSSKNLEPMWVGEWTVSVVDEAGNVLAKRNLAYTELEGGEESVDGPVPASPMD